MKRFALLATLCLALLLILPAVAYAGSYTQVIKVPGSSIDDVHLRAYYWTAGPTRNDLPISSATVRYPNGTSAGTTTVSGSTTATCDSPVDWPSGQQLVVNLKSPSSARNVYLWYEWTKDGTVVWKPLGDYEDIEYPGAAQNAVVGLDAWVQRSIKLTLTDTDLSFGRVRYGDGVYTQATQLHVESNDEYSLYVSGHPADPVRDMTEFLDVRIEESLSGWLWSSGMGDLAGEHTCSVIGEDLDGGVALPPPANPDWWVESFFDVYFDVDPEPGHRPGYYQCDVDFFAIQNL